MHYVGLEYLGTRRFRTSIPDLRGLAVPAHDVSFLAAAHGLYRFERAGEPVPVALPESFHPRLLIEAPRQEVFVVDEWGDTLIFGVEGTLRRRVSLGSEIADAATDDFGIFVYRRTGRLDKFTFDGQPIPDDVQVRRVNAASRAQEGALLLVPYDGSVWLNLEEHFDDAGERAVHLDTATLFGEGRVAGDLLGDEGILVLTEQGRFVAVDAGGASTEVRCDSDRVRKSLGRDLTASVDCLATRADLLTVLSTDVGALSTFQVFFE